MLDLKGSATILVAQAGILPACALVLEKLRGNDKRIRREACFIE